MLIRWHVGQHLGFIKLLYWFCFSEELQIFSTAVSYQWFEDIPFVIFGHSTISLKAFLSLLAQILPPRTLVTMMGTPSLSPPSLSTPCTNHWAKLRCSRVTPLWLYTFIYKLYLSFTYLKTWKWTLVYFFSKVMNVFFLSFQNLWYTRSVQKVILMISGLPRAISLLSSSKALLCFSGLSSIPSWATSSNSI